MERQQTENEDLRKLRTGGGADKAAGWQPNGGKPMWEKAQDLALFLEM